MPDEPLSRHTTFRIGGPADAWVEVNDGPALATVLDFCTRTGTDWLVLGRGSNVLVSDQGLRGVVISLGSGFRMIEVTETLVRAGAAAQLDDVAEQAVLSGLAGAEFLAGIPGTVAGGLRTNAGAFGHQMSDILETVRAMQAGGAGVKAREFGRAELHGEYRRPVVRELVVVTGVHFRLVKGVAEAPADIRARRWQKQPAEPSAGSFFKNPDSEPAGRLIERCGLKGRRAGGAQVSEKHANFIINTGGARFRDVLELAQIVMAVVEEQTGVCLEPEVIALPDDRR